MTRKTIRPAFVTTFAAAASATMIVAAGCSTTVAFSPDEPSCTFGDPGCDAPCPTTTPSDGSSCSQEGQSCYWDDCDTGQSDSAICDGGTWDVTHGTIGCNPPPPDPVCPRDLPEHGAACDTGWDGPYTCDGYTDPFCEIEVTATCQNDGTWFVDQIECNPPPPDFCQTLGDVESCTGSAGCVWHEPGCADGDEETVRGCFSEFACSPGTCGLDETCTTVVIDPCWDSLCNACAAETNVCLPDPV